jgi:hypothetical protein
VAKKPVDAQAVADADYKVGYGKPPRDHQFKKNDSRPRKRSGKGSTPIGSGVATRLDRPLTVHRNGKPEKVHPHELQMLSLGRKALEGSSGALREFLKECEDAGLLEPELIERISNVLVEPDGANTHILGVLVKQHGGPPPGIPKSITL